MKRTWKHRRPAGWLPTMADGQINDGSSVQYGKTQYWDERYTEDPAQFDWCGGRACRCPTAAS